MPPCTMPNSALALPRRSNSARERAAQRSDSSIDAAASSRVAGYGVHSSNTITMSESSACWICIEISGVRNSLSPLTGEANATPSSCTRRSGAEAPHLEAARVGEDRPLPAHEAVQAAVRGDHLEARAQPQVEGVAEHDLRADLDELRGRHRLDRAVGADRHEHRRLDGAVGEREPTAPGRARRGDHLELHATARPLRRRRVRARRAQPTSRIVSSEAPLRQRRHVGGIAARIERERRRALAGRRSRTRSSTRGGSRR